MLSANISEHQRYLRSISKVLFGILLICTISAVSLNPVYAIGPGTGGSKIRVNEEQVGPYVLLVATSPLPVTLDQQMSVWVRVSDGQTEELRRDAVVTVEATPRDGGPTLTAQATHQNAGNDYDYVAHFEVQNTGQWDITVTVEDAPGPVDVSFVETVSSGVSTTVIIGLAIPFVVIAAVIGVYLWRRSEDAG